jgi:hypothetical protein
MQPPKMFPFVSSNQPKSVRAAAAAFLKVLDAEARALDRIRRGDQSEVVLE